MSPGGGPPAPPQVAAAPSPPPVGAGTVLLPPGQMPSAGEMQGPLDARDPNNPAVPGSQVVGSNAIPPYRALPAPLGDAAAPGAAGAGAGAPPAPPAQPSLLQEPELQKFIRTAKQLNVPPEQIADMLGEANPIFKVQYLAAVAGQNAYTRILDAGIRQQNADTRRADVGSKIDSRAARLELEYSKLNQRRQEWDRKAGELKLTNDPDYQVLMVKYKEAEKNFREASRARNNPNVDETTLPALEKQMQNALDIANEAQRDLEDWQIDHGARPTKSKAAPAAAPGGEGWKIEPVQ
jgi:hypothetical protein